MIVLKTGLFVLLEVILFASLGNGNFTFPMMFNAIFYASYFGLPIVVLRCANIHSLFSKQGLKFLSLEFWKNLFLFIGPCIVWAIYGLCSPAENWANSLLPLSLVGYVASELIVFAIILGPRRRKN